VDRAVGPATSHGFLADGAEIFSLHLSCCPSSEIHKRHNRKLSFLYTKTRWP